MNNIIVKEIEHDEKGWKYQVTIMGAGGQTIHQVLLTKDYFNLLTAGVDVRPENLVKESIRFLLEREPKESILSAFDLKIINNYFPEYEDEIKERCNG